MKVRERQSHNSSVSTARGAPSRPRQWRCWLASLITIAAIGVLPIASFAFIDDFEDGDISDWIVKCGGWQVVEGFGGGLAIASAQFDNLLMHSTLSASYGHYHYEVYFPNDNRADGDLYFRIVGSDFYWLLLGPDNSDNVADRILRASDGGCGCLPAIGCAPFHLSRESWHRIDVYHFPNGVTQVFMDNESTPRIEAYDATIVGAGGIAIRTAVAGVRFDNVSFDPALPPNPEIPAPSTCPPWNGVDVSCSVDNCGGDGIGGPACSGGGGGGDVPVPAMETLGLVAAVVLLGFIAGARMSRRRRARSAA